MQIKTNNKPRDIIDGVFLTEKDRAEFDWIDWQDIDSGNNGASFFRYKGNVYDLGEFMLCPDSFLYKDWQGTYSDSAFSGILIKFNGEQVIVARYFS